MDQFFGSASEYIQEHWLEAVVAVVFMAAGWLIGHRRAKQQWEKKDFLDRVNITLNTIHNGKLLIRTLIEKPCEEVFLNSVAVKNLLKAADQTSPEQPIIPVPETESWYYLNSVLNEISERFADGMIKRDLGLDVRKENYLICLTNEKAGDLRTRKIRAIVIQKNLLTSLPEKQPAFESPNHATRWKTLQQLGKRYQSAPHQFLDMEICV